MKSILLVLISLGLAVVISHTVVKNKIQKEELNTMNIEIIIGDQVLHGELYDNETAQDLISQLPIEVMLEDYANTEKIFYPAEKLSTKNAPSGYEPTAGDITYYAPWGDIAIFYKNFVFSGGLISVGRIDEEDISKLKFKGSKKATIKVQAD